MLMNNNYHEDNLFGGLLNMPSDNMEQYSMFTYYRPSSVSQEQTIAELDRILSLIASFDSSIIHNFDLSNFTYNTLDGKIKGKSPSERICLTVYRLFRYLVTDEVKYRIIHKNYSVYVHVTKPSQKLVGVSSELTLVAINNFTSNPSMIVHRYKIAKSSVESNKIELLRSSGSPYKSSLTHTNEYRYDDFISHDYLLSLVADSLDTYVTDYRSKQMDSHLEYQKNSIENAFIEKAFKSLMKSGKVLSVNIDSLVKKYSTKDRTSSMNKLVYGRVIRSNRERYEWTGYKLSPLIKFTDDYADFISEYVDHLGIFNPYERTNILPYLIFPRYGSKISFQISNNKFIFTDFEIVGNTVNVYAQYFINDNITISGFAQIYNPSHFNIEKSIYNVQINMNYMDNTNSMDLSFNEVVGSIPEELTSSDNMLKLIKDIITIYIAIHDRPGTKVSKNKPNPRKKSEFYGRGTDADIVVCKLTLPLDEIRKRIRRGYYEQERRDPYNFVAQHWIRKGHQRHNANGTISYVKEHWCHRRKPLTNKEVHITD